MYKLQLYQARVGWQWMWKVVFTKGKKSKVLARSGQSYSRKHGALVAFHNFMGLRGQIGEE